jgi:hypothetical protein
MKGRRCVNYVVYMFHFKHSYRGKERGGPILKLKLDFNQHISIM